MEKKKEEPSIMLRIGRNGKVEYVTVNQKTGLWRGHTSLTTKGPTGKIQKRKKMTRTGIISGVEGQLEWKPVKKRIKPEIMERLRKKAHTHMSIPSAVYVKRVRKPR